jgi:hypothetical protein
MTPTVLIVAGCAFLAALLWHEILIEWPARSTADISSDDRAIISGYYRRMTVSHVRANQLALAAVASTVIAGLIVQVANADIPVWAAGVSALLLATIGALVASITWPAAKQLARNDGLPQFTQLARRLWWLHCVAVLMLATVAVIQIVAVSL